MELMTMPPAWFNMLYKIAIDKQEQDPEAIQKRAEADAVEQIIEEGGGV